MDTKYILLILFTFCVLSCDVNSWFFGDSENDGDADDDFNKQPESAASLSTRTFPFEINTADDRFLLEASIAKELSVLDACHHRVVSELEGRCNDLSEEELAKLSVSLFNCQAAVEKRQTYSCTSDMAIAECTRDMDSTTWNAYQIVSNRARSVCYGVRQQYFRARAEQTVNRLMSSSEQQLRTLASVSQTQLQLKSMADSTIEQLETSRQQIADDQKQLRQAHQTMNSHVISNLQHIQREKKVILAGNKQLITNTKQIQKKLESTAEQLNEQGEMQSVRHKELLLDLAQLDAQAKDVSSKLDVSMTAVENFQRNVLEHQQDAIANLKHINDTVNFLLSLLNGVRDVVESKLEWIVHVTGVTEIRVAVISVITAHISYAVVAVILSRLLHATRHICYLLLTLIWLNAAVELKFSSGLGCIQLAGVALAVGFVAVLIPRCWAIMIHHPPPAEPVTERMSCDGAKRDQILSSEDIKHVVTALEQLSADFRRRISDSREEENMASVRISSSTPIRHLPQLVFDGVNDHNKTVGSLLDCTPPPIRRHVLPVSPRNPPPTPVVNNALLMNGSGLLRLPGLESGDSSRPGSPAGSVGSSGTPRTTHRRKSRNGSLSRSFSRCACIAVTKSGQGCKLPSQEGSSFCHRHQFS